MKVKVRYLTYLRELFGKEEEEYIFEEQPTVEELSKIIVKEYLKNRKSFQRKWEENLIFLVNGKNIITLEEMRTKKLNDGDVLVVLYPSAGG